MYSDGILDNLSEPAVNVIASVPVPNVTLLPIEFLDVNFLVTLLV